MPAAPDGLARATPEWPAPAAAIDAARVFLQRTSGQLTAIACDSDVDGLAAGVIVERAVRSRGGSPLVLPVRTAGDTDLLAWLRAVPFRPSAPSEYANGHARATGGSLSTADFDRFLTALGFQPSTPKRQAVAHP